MALQIQRFVVKKGVAVSKWSRMVHPVTSLDVTKATATPRVQSRFIQSQPVAFQRTLFSDVTAVSPVPQHALHHIRRWSSFTSDRHAGKNISYEEMAELSSNKEFLIIDIREPSELAETGLIGDSVNIPVGDLYSAFSLSKEDFKERYKVSMPSTSDDKVVIHCLKGIRSRAALDILCSLGFDKIRHYPGGWQEWAARKGSQK